MSNKFLVGNVLREVKNARLNCNNSKNETNKGSVNNGTYVKKIRRNKETFPYASAQWQKKNIKEFANSSGLEISDIVSVSTKEAVSEGNPYKNYDEDIMGFMIAKNLDLSADEYKELDNESQEGFKKTKNKQKEVVYRKNVTKKRRANLMLSPLQAIGNTRIEEEFCTRKTDKTPLIYTKEIYSTNMSSGFIFDIDKVGRFKVCENESAYRDYFNKEIQMLGLENDDAEVKLEKEQRLNRVNTTLDALYSMTTRTTMTNNLEDLTAKFVIMSEYSIGSAMFNNIFEDNRLKIDYLKQSIDENEKYRMSNIYIGVRDEFFKQDGEFLIDLIKMEFGKDDRFVICGVGEIIDNYKKHLSETL